jgi:hypothetical protein
MPTIPLTREECVDAVSAVDAAIKAGYLMRGKPSAVSRAGELLNLNRKQVEHRILMAQQKWGVGQHIVTAAQRVVVSDASKRLAQITEAEKIKSAPKLPDFADDDIPESEIIDLMCRRFEKRSEHKASKRWFRIEMPTDQPFAIMWWGDPHLDSNGTNWPLIRRHAALAQFDGVYSVNIGDTLDNWPHGSKLMSLYAESDQSVGTAHKLARWFLKGSGINWLLWLLGNHDTFSGHTSAEWLREVGGHRIAFEEWGAQFVLACPGGTEYRIWAAHNFPGHSQWNSLHGPQKAASMKEDADIYVCGHLHNWAIHKEESSNRGFTYSLLRARGYKFIDDYAEKLGYLPQQHGASIMTVFDPDSGRHHSFEHPEDGIVFLQALRESYDEHH